MAPVLSQVIRLVLIQFSFSNRDEVPGSIRRREPETPDGSRERKTHTSGTLVVEPTENCSTAWMLEDLEDAGYRMVDAFSEERIHEQGSPGKRAYWTVRFTFARREYAVTMEEFRRTRDAAREDFSRMCRRALWRVRVFENPFYQNDEEVRGERTLSVNLEGRRPLFQGNGEPVVAWQEGGRGDGIGDAPRPLAASRRVRLVRGTFCLLPV